MEDVFGFENSKTIFKNVKKKKQKQVIQVLFKMTIIGKSKPVTK